MPKDEEALANLLDKNGYYGRHTIERYAGPSYKDICVKIKIYLPNSIFTYQWPYGAYYNLTQDSFSKRKKPSVVQNNFKLIKCMYFFTRSGIIVENDIEKVAELGSLYMGWAKKEEYFAMIRFLMKARFFNNGRFVLKTEDVLEVHDNLFDFKYYILD
jgi:hypothetical protein